MCLLLPETRRNWKRLSRTWRYVTRLFMARGPCLVLQKCRRSSEQKLKYYSYSLTDLAASTAALQAASDEHDGKCPDAVFLCAGASRPGFFIEENEDTLRTGMDNAYWVQAFSALVSYLLSLPLLNLIINVGSCEENGQRRRSGKDRACLVAVGIYVYRWVFFIFPRKTRSTR